ncbi:hypothetical protein EHS25_008341 [Saitozyma podzolica]|uniref:Extracellular membrane protein CFEM domain-containing protein n=1 Tax=Saitozyma podzolica TaxID=1890683 RepID=A0A427YPA3_9TREE|nr:hypothetical protein EHS25_008341 [Saitozyma podzolica]
MKTRFVSILAIALGALGLVGVANASAAAQFHLDPQLDVSACWLECHNSVVAAIHNPLSKLAIAEAITINCQNDTYIETMPQCLVEYCTSAPSTAYALEYGFSWCRRAGVDVTSSLALPQSYLDGPASAYFNSTAYLTSSGVRSLSSAFTGLAMVLATTVLSASLLAV